jgi:membrane fusion protein (multidrug efflux system)
MKRYINYLGILLPVMLIAGCGEKLAGENTSAAGTESAKMPTVETVNPKERNFAATINIIGTAKANRVVKLHAMESGYVQKMYKDIGDVVKAGEIIARLENPELNRNFQKQKALMEAKKSIYDRLQGIADKTPALTSLDQLEMAKAEYESTLAEYKATTDRIGFLKVKSPFNGVVTKRHVDKGALVQSGITEAGAMPLVEVMELDIIRLAVSVPESDVSAVDTGTEVAVVFPELAGEVFQARVSRISRALSEKSKTMDIEIDIQNPDFKIKPGMYARVNMQISSREDVLSVPNTALVVYQDDFFIYTVDSGIVKRIPIRRGLHNKDYFEILDAGIKSSSQIITRGKNLVEPGMNVKAIIKKQQQ